MLSEFRDRLASRLFMDERYSTIMFISIGILLIAILGNVIYLNTVLLNRKESLSTVSKLNNTKNISNVLSPTISPTLIPLVSPTSQPAQILPTQLIKDYFIPLGSGSTQATTWTDVAGATAQVNFGSYTNVKEIHLEASVVVPNANQTVGVRLFNVTDQHPVWYSDVYMNSNQTSAYLTSSPIVYDTGLKTYQVQMETQLGAVANLVQARIHILLK